MFDKKIRAAAYSTISYRRVTEVDKTKDIKKRQEAIGDERHSDPINLIPYFVAIKRDTIHPVFTNLVPSSLGRGHRCYKSCLAKFISVQDLLYHIQDPLSASADVSRIFREKPSPRR